jgi:hypothetical protein
LLGEANCAEAEPGDNATTNVIHKIQHTEAPRHRDLLKDFSVALCLGVS